MGMLFVAQKESSVLAVKREAKSAGFSCKAGGKIPKLF